MYRVQIDFSAVRITQNQQQFNSTKFIINMIIIMCIVQIDFSAVRITQNQQQFDSTKFIINMFIIMCTVLTDSAHRTRNSLIRLKFIVTNISIMHTVQINSVAIRNTQN